jgi:hypothetical protein
MEFNPPYYPYLRIQDNAHRMHMSLIFGHVRQFKNMAEAKRTLIKMSAAAADAGYMWAMDDDSISFYHRSARHEVGQILFNPTLCLSISLSSSGS